MHVTPLAPSRKICAESCVSGLASLPLRLMKLPVMVTCEGPRPAPLALLRRAMPQVPARSKK